jgi:FkbM family methyltransferase
MTANPEIIHHSFAGQQFHFYSTPTLPQLIHEIFNDNYHILQKNMIFTRGDIILDCGANEGLFSILMAKLFPQTTVISLEPVPRTFYQMIRNIGLNGVSNINPINLGVAAKNDTIAMTVSNEYSGGSTACMTFNPDTTYIEKVGVVTLDSIINSYCVGHPIKLLKMDIEGMEYETLYNFNSWDKIENFVGEVHTNGRLRRMGYEIPKLVDHIAERTNLLYYEPCNMAE